jgi:CheY-like chemotaxis protein
MTMQTPAMNIPPAAIALRLAQIKVLVVDDEPGSRKVVRTLLSCIGVRTLHEAADGLAGLDAVRALKPDVVILDWEMPGLKGPNFMRMLRSPQTFPYPDTPVIMLTGHGERAYVTEAVDVGINEYLLKPVSSKGLLDRMISVLFKPRPMVIEPNYYGPARRASASVVKQNAAEDISKYTMLN